MRRASDLLSKDSDFKIEYTFEEVEVPVGESPGERDAAEPADGGAEEEFLGFRGKVVKACDVAEPTAASNVAGNMKTPQMHED